MSTTTSDNSARLTAEPEAQTSGHDDNASTSPPANASVTAPTSRRRPAAKDSCMVADCRRKLNSRYERRYRLCSPHMKAPQFLVSSRLCRWCQKCGKFHPMDDFDGMKKSCRASLARHNERQKEARLRRHDSAAQLQLAGCPSGMDLRPKAGPALEEAGTEASATPVFACAASLPLPQACGTWEVTLPLHHSVLPQVCVEPLTVGPPPAQQAQAELSGDAASSLAPHSVITTVRLAPAPSAEPPLAPPPIEADIAAAFSAAVHAAADAAGATVHAHPAPGGGFSATGSMAGAVLTHAALLEPSLDAREAHELRSLGLDHFDPIYMPPVLEIPL